MNKKALPIILIFFLLLYTTYSILPMAHAQTCNNTVSPPLCQATGTPITVNNGQGDQLDPRVYGNTISYTSLVGTVSNIHYYNIATATDTTISNGGAFDYLSDTNGGTIFFTRLSNSGQGIFSYNVAAAATKELSTTDTVSDAPRVGGNIVVWQDFSLGNGAGSDALVIYNLSTATTTTLYNDGNLNELADVSPDGTVVTWTNCKLSGTGCVIYDAIQSCSSSCTWAVNQLTTNGAESSPHTNGKVVVYASTTNAGSSATTNIYIQPVTGGTAQEIAPSYMADESAPTISGNLIAFDGETLSASAPNIEIYVYDMDSGDIYQISTSQTVALNDIYLSPSGVATVVWQSQTSTGSWSVYAFTFGTSFTTLTLNPATVEYGGQTTVQATVSQPPNSANPLTGTITFSAGSAGGSFGSTTCLPSGINLVCTATYTAPSSDETVTITGTYGGDPLNTSTPGTASLTVIAPPAKLVFITTPQTLIAGSCSGITTLQTQDSSGNPSYVESDTTVVLTSTPLGGTFYSDLTCTTSISSVTIAATTNSASFYFKDTLAGSVVLHANSTELRSASQTEKVLPGPVATVSVAPPRLNTIVGSPIPTLFKATAKDQFGNIRSGDAITWSVGSRGGTISSTGLYTTGTTGGLFIVKAKDGTPFGYALVFVAKSPTATSVSPMSTNPDTYVVGSPIYFNVVVSNAGPIQLPSLPSGTVTWSESEVGGLFSNGHGKYNQCTLGVQSSTNACSVYYSTTHVGQVTITASYGGDQTFQGSSNTYSITVLSMTQAFSALSNAISNLPLSSAQSSYLDYDLSDAESSYGTFNCKAGANFMEAFIDQIYSYEQQGILTSAQGDPLIEDANAIISGAHYCQITLQTNGS